MKNKMQVLMPMIVFSIFTVLNMSAQQSARYAYQNTNGTYVNPNGSYVNPNTYGNNRDARYQSRAYYSASPELQRLYQTEDALIQRYNADLALGDRRATRIDGERLEDVRTHIAREESRYARLNSNYHNNYRERRNDYDHDGRR